MEKKSRLSFSPFSLSAFPLFSQPAGRQSSRAALPPPYILPEFSAGGADVFGHLLERFHPHQQGIYILILEEFL